MIANRSIQFAALSLAIFLAATSHGQTTRQATFLNMAQLVKLADKGDATAQCEIGRRHLLGKGMKASAENAATWFGKAAAAGSADALFELFIMSRDGIGMAKDAEKADKLLKESLEAGSTRAQIEMAVRATENKSDAAAVDAAIGQLTRLARAGDGWAQLALGQALAGGAGKAEGGEALQWLLKASNADDERIALAAARVFRDGEGDLRADSARAAMLFRKLIDKEVRSSHDELVNIAPDSYRGVCKEQTVERISRDDRLMGSAARVEGKLGSAEKGEWSIADRKSTIRIKLQSEAPAGATAGRIVRVWGLVEEPGIVRGLLTEVPEPKVEHSFKLTEPRVMKGSNKENYVVNGEVRNTGKQHINSLKVSVRVFQEESGKEDTEELTITDLPIGERRAFTAAFKIENVKASDNPTGIVQAAVKVADVEW